MLVCAVLVGADDFVEIEEWANEKVDWLRQYLALTNGIPSHDTFGRVFATLDAEAFAAAFRRWVSGLLPVLDKDEVVAIDAMGTQPNIAQTIRDRGANYILSVKDNQPKLADSVQDFFVAFQSAPDKTPHQFDEVVGKDHGRLEVRRCYAFDQIDCLHAPERWPDITSFAVIASQRTIKGKTTLEHRLYISSLPADAARLNHAVRQHLRVESSLHWCMDVVFGDDQMRARTGHAAHNFAVLRHIALNLIRLAPVKRKGGLKVRRLIAATSDNYRAQLLGLV